MGLMMTSSSMCLFDNRERPGLVTRIPGGKRLSGAECRTMWPMPSTPAYLPLVYEEPRRVARRHLRNERPDHTQQTTALINEAYLRRMEQGVSEVRDRCHF